MKRTLTQSDTLILGGATVTVLLSFIGFTEWSNAWGQGLRFVATLPALLSLVVLGVGIAELLGTDLPDELVTFTSPQIKTVLATAAALMLLAWATTDVSKSFAFWLQLLGAIAAATGGFAALTGRLTNPVMRAPVAPPPPPGAPGSSQPPMPPADDFTPPPPPPD